MTLPLSRRSAVSAVLLACALLLAAAGVLVLVTGGTKFQVGDLSVSLRDPGRLFLDSSLAMLVREVLCRGLAARPRRVIAVVGFLMVALVWESSPRLVGDGSEYVTMTRQISLGRPPGLLPAEIDESVRYLSVFGGSEIPPRVHGVQDRYGRQQLEHSRAYSLLASPFAVVARLVGVHPNHAFTVLNALLLCGAAAVAAPRIGLAATSLLLLGPAIWWVDKAHTELLTLSSLTAAGLLLPTHPGVAIPLVGLATLQNPPLAVVLVAAIAWVLLRRGTRAWVACTTGVGIAVVYPLYYWWTIGRVSPLAGTTLRHWPGATAYLTPLLDPNLGVIWAFAGLTVGILLVLPTLVRPALITRFWVEGALLAACLLTLLFAFAQATNVNHGGTPGPSRYTMWLVPLAAPLFKVGSLAAGTARQRALSVVAVASLVSSAVFYHPKLPQDCRHHTRLAQWLLTSWPRLYNPLPEVFSERTLSTDGEFMVPAAMPRCEKVLLVGGKNGAARWPIPCEPAPVPERCSASGLLCYASRSAGRWVFVRVPAQEGLPPATQMPAWDETDRAAWDVLGFDWGTAERVPPLSKASFVRGADDVARVLALQTDHDLLAWVWTMASRDPSLTLRLPARGSCWMLDAAGPPPILPPPTRALERGQSVMLTPGETILLLARGTAPPGAGAELSPGRSRP